MRATLEIPCEQAPLGPASFGGKAFDVIYHSDVMSHFYDPVGEFRRMHAALRPGGWLIFETGNGGDVDPKYLEHVSVFQYPDHLFFFSLANVRALLELSGFDLVELHSYSVLPQLRTLETIESGKPVTPFMKFGDHVRMEAMLPDGSAGPFGMIDQHVVAAKV